MRAHIILLALVCVLIGQLTAPAQAAAPKTEREFHAALKKANPDYTGKGKVYRNDKDGIWGADISSCKVSTLEPLRGMPIRVLACSDNTIKDLTPLKGMRLLQLVCDNNPITDLSPISGMPIWKLGIKGTKVTDLTPLEDMKLRDFVFSPGNITKGIDIVRNMKTIQFYPTPEQRNLSRRGDGAHLMTLMTSEKFWKLYDQEYGKKSQASSPAEPEQVAGGRSRAPSPASNPDYLAWSRFRPGSMAKYEERDQESGEVSKTLKVLKSVTDDKVVIELTTSEGNSQPPKSETTEIAAVNDSSSGAAADTLEQDTRLMEVGRRSLKCEYTRYRFGDLDVEVWRSTEAPGGLVRRELRIHRLKMGENVWFNVNSRLTTALVDFKAVRK